MEYVTSRLEGALAQEIEMADLVGNATLPDYLISERGRSLFALAAPLFLLACFPFIVRQLRKWRPDENGPCCSPITGGIILGGVLFVAQAVLFSLFVIGERSPLTLSAAAAQLLSVLVITISSIVSRNRGSNASGFVFNYWLVSCLCGIPSAYHAVLGLTRQELGSPVLEYVTVLVVWGLTNLVLLLTFFTDRKSTDEKAWPEYNCSFPSQLSFEWFSPLVRLGHKRPLVKEDLWNIHDENKTETQLNAFEAVYLPAVRKYLDKKANSTEPVPDSERPSLLWAIVKRYKGQFLLSFLFDSASEDLQFISPILLHYLLVFVKSPDQPVSVGVLIALGMFALYVVSTFLITTYMITMLQFGLNLRTALTGALYKKALRLSSTARRNRTTGEIVNLMSVDAEKLEENAPWVMTLLTSPLTIIIAFIFLWNLLGVAVVAGILALVASMPLNSFLSIRIANLQDEQLECKDERVKLMSEVLNGIKVLKLYSWERGLMNQARMLIQKIREKEIYLLRKIAFYNAFVTLAWRCAPFLISVATFAAYVTIDHENNVLTPEKTFVALVLFNIIAYPILQIASIFSDIVECMVSVRRLEDFFCEEEMDNDSIEKMEQQGAAISMENSSFTWNKNDETQTLKNININVKRGELIAVVGKVGCGKSSLISAMLGELHKVDGSVKILENTAYVPQQAWIQNLKLRDNVTFGLEYDFDRYDKSLEACALKADLENLPAGDLTEIGEKGINLSGGQKARVSLARAVYSCLSLPGDKLVFLDDPLAAVDAHVAKHIFENVISNDKGALRETTRILVTHSIHYLKFCDRVIVMQDGAVSEQGTYRELLASQGAFSAFIEEFLFEEVAKRSRRRSTSKSEVEEVLHDLEALSPAKVKRLESRLSEVSEELKFDDTEETEEKEIDDTKPLIEEKEKDDGQLIEDEELATGKVPWRVYCIYLKAITFVIVAIYGTLFVASTIFEIFAGLWLSEWSDHAEEIQKGPHGTFETNKRLIIYALLLLGQSLSTCIAIIIIAFGMRVASRVLHNELLENVLHSPMSFFDTTPIGRIVNRFGRDIDMLDSHLPGSLTTFVSEITQALTTLFLTLCATPIMTIVLIPPMIYYFYIMKFYISTSRQLKRLESASRSPIFSNFQEALQGASSIRAYKAVKRFTDYSALTVDENSNMDYHQIVANRWLTVRLELVGNLIVLFACLFSVFMRDSPAITAGLVGLSISYALQITNQLNWVVRVSSDLESNIVAVERISEYSEHITEGLPIECEPKDPNWPSRGNIAFEDFKLRYRPGLDLTLKGITAKVKAGEKIGIVGRTGAGKSSLTLALFRIVEADSGHIEIDGERIDRLKLDTLRSRITIVPQEPVLFSGPLRMNLDPLDKHTDEEIWQALRESHLESFVRNLSEELLHEVAENGENFSVGQRQLLCLSRALLRKTKILVLDEAAAAVDMESDALIQKAVREQFKECTVLTIAHRLNTIMDYDRIIVMADGMIAEMDSPAALLANRDSIFREMAQQAGIAF